MKNFICFITIILFVTCANNTPDEIPPNEIPPDETCKLSDLDSSFGICKQFLDTTSGLKLYRFAPYTDVTTLNMRKKLEQRQIPENCLIEMSTKALFYQVVYTDLSTNMVLYSSPQLGFEALTRDLNMIPELLNRPDAGYVLLELLQNLDPAKIDGFDCWLWKRFLQIFLLQVEVINNMTDEDIDRYIDEQLRCYDIIRCIDDFFPQNVIPILYGLGNVMIRYEFEPFLQAFEPLIWHPVTNDFIWRWDDNFFGEQYALLLIDIVKQFKNRKR